MTNQEYIARLEKVQAELRELQNEVAEPGTSFLALDIAVSAVIIAWHMPRKERGMARHNFEDIQNVVPKLELLFSIT